MTKATSFEAIVHVVKTAPSLNKPTRQVQQATLTLRGALLQPSHCKGGYVGRCVDVMAPALPCRSTCG